MKKITLAITGLLKFNISKYKRITFLLCILLLSIHVSYAQTKSNSVQQINELNDMFARIAASNSYVEDLNYNDAEAINLPLGLKRTIGGMEITIASVVLPCRLLLQSLAFTQRRSFHKEQKAGVQCFSLGQKE